jgi:hypothetical protein
VGERRGEREKKKHNHKHPREPCATDSHLLP